MKNYLAAVALTTLLGCTQQELQKGRGEVSYTGKTIDNSVQQGKTPKKHDPDCNSGFFHDMMQLPVTFSGTVDGWLKITKSCPEDGAPFDTYTFLVKTERGTKKVTIESYQDDEREYMEKIAVKDTKVTVVGGIRHLSDVRDGIDNNYRTTVTDFKRTQEETK